MKRVYILLVLLVVFPLSFVVRPVVQAGEAPVKAPKEKAVPEAAAKKAEPVPKEKAVPEAAAKKAEPVPKEKAVPEAAAKKAEPEKKATLTLKPGEKNTFGIDLKNSVPVRGIQFTLSGLKMTEVRTASRTAGFLAKFNEETGIVILVSTAADEIAPGKGSVLKILGEKVPDADVSLSKIMIADRDRNLIE